MEIKILGAGCKKCTALAENAKSAADAAGIDANIEKVTDLVDIARYGVMSSPALVVEDKVVATGKVLSAKEIGVFLLEAAR